MVGYYRISVCVRLRQRRWHDVSARGSEKKCRSLERTVGRKVTLVTSRKKQFVHLLKFCGSKSWILTFSPSSLSFSSHLWFSFYPFLTLDNAVMLPSQHHLTVRGNSRFCAKVRVCLRRYAKLGKENNKSWRKFILRINAN